MPFLPPNQQRQITEGKSKHGRQNPPDVQATVKQITDNQLKLGFLFYRNITATDRHDYQYIAYVDVAYYYT